MRAVFMGSAEFAVPSLDALVAAPHTVVLVVTRADKPCGRGLELSTTPVKRRALELGLPVFQPVTLRDEAVQRQIRDANPDVIVVVAYGRILPPEILSIPRLGCINVHGSLLPRYRGAAPVQRAIMEGETETGVTIIRMDEGVDTGPILAAASTQIEPRDTAATLSERLAAMGAKLLLETLQAVADGTAIARPQDETRATLAPILKKDDGAINWSVPSRKVSDLVRAVEPWPGAYTFTPRGLRLRIFPFLEPVEVSMGVPGEVLSIGGDGMVVKTGDGGVIIRELQPAGSRRMTPREAQAGRRIAVSDILGPAP